MGNENRGNKRGNYVSYRQRSKKLNNYRKNIRAIIIACAVCVVLMAAFIIICNRVGGNDSVVANSDIAKDIKEDNPLGIVQDFLEPNVYSRPQTPLEKVNGIVVHYTANPGTDALANRNYFNGLAQSGETYASSHFVIGLDGKIIQCIPLNEISYASNERNNDTISIECCHPTKNGKFTDETYNSLVNLAGYLCDRYDISTDNIIRHYDVTGKMCPKYYVKHEKKWIEFKEDVKKHMTES